MTAPQTLDGAGEAGKATRRRRVRPHATRLFWALWFAGIGAYVIWAQTH